MSANSFVHRLKLILGGPAIAFIGVAVIYWGISERRLAETASAEPEAIRLADLIARGPEGNPHILLTEIEMCDNFVYQKREKSETWSKVWIPIVPKGSAQNPRDPSDPVSAILLSERVSNASEIDTKLSKQPQLQGMVTNLIDRLHYSEQRLLERSYPGTDFTKCIIFEEGRTPAGPLKVYSLWAAGGVLILVGLGSVVYGVAPTRARKTQP
ncbi:MAG: hypothetical protein K8T25_22555 [Planctomycetia bacterium]|nr:hypothetical protein [Planctomycetia bacterium]